MDNQVMEEGEGGLLVKGAHVIKAGQIIRILPKLKLQAARFRTPGELQTPSLER